MTTCSMSFVSIFKSWQFGDILSTNYVVEPLPAREAHFQKQELFQGKPQWLYYTLGLGITCGLSLFWRAERCHTRRSLLLRKTASP